MTGPRFAGTGVAVVTPFQADGGVDNTSLTKIIEHLIAGQAEYLVVLGTTGESATLTHEEKQQVFTHTARTTGGRLPLVAGIGGNDTKSVIEDIRGFDLTGYNAILSVSPYYNKPSQEGIYRHYQSVAAASPLPIILYNVPGRTGMNMTAETTLRIARDCPNVIGIKEASGNLEQVMRILQEKPTGFEVISGDDAITLPLIALGATGVISVIANAYPRRYSDMVRACLNGDFATARPDHFRMLEAIDTLFAEGSPSGIKAYLSEMGLCGYHLRLPVVPVSQALSNRIRGIMSKL